MTVKILSFILEQNRIEYNTLPNRKATKPRWLVAINYDGQVSLMLHTKFRENRPAGSGEDF